MIISVFKQHKKNKAIRFLGVALVLFICSFQSSAQELGLDRFMHSVLKNNPGVQKILAEKEIAEGALEANRGIDDAEFASSLSLSHSEPDKIFGSEPNTSENKNLNLSYKRLFSDSGTRLSLDYNNIYTDRSPASVYSGSQYYQPSFTVRLTQPLLKNAGGIQDRLNVKISQIDYRLSKLSSQENLESYITQLASLYVDWYLASQELKISEDVHQRAIAQEKLTQTKVKRQVSEPYELLRAQEIREDYFSRLQQAKGRFIGLTHQINSQMNENKMLTENTLIPLNPKNSVLLSDSKNMLRQSDYLEGASRLKSILDSLNQQQLILLEAKDNARSSDLNLNVGYTRHGLNEDLSDAHNSGLKKDDYSVMLEYKYLLGNRKANGNLQSQAAKKRQIEADTRQRLIDAKATLANLKIQSSQLKIAIKSVDRKISLGQKKLKKEQHLYRIGKLDLFELLKDQTSHLESRLNREQLYTQQLILQLKIGELLDHNLESITPQLKSDASKVI